MSTSRKLRRQLNRSPASLDRAASTLQQIQKVQGSLEDLSVLTATLEALRQDLLELSRSTEDQLTRLNTLKESFALLVPYIDAPMNVKAQALDILKVP